MTTDTSERGLERLICEALTGEPCDPPSSGTVGEPTPGYGGVGWSPGNGRDYDREYCVDLVQLRTFLEATQPESAAALPPSPQTARHAGSSLARLQGEINKRGTIDVLRGGIRHGPHHLELLPRHAVGRERDGPAALRAEPLHGHPPATLQPGRDPARARHRAVHQRSFPSFTLELKNNLTKQTVHDAIRQYERDRSRREPLFRLGRCVAHFAVDESEVHFCTHLKGKASWFLPFNRGRNQGAGNPAQPGRPSRPSISGARC